VGLKEALAAPAFGAGLRSNPTMRGRLNKQVLGCGSRVISKIFGKVTVTDADLTLTKKRWCSALTSGIETL
jgi:hypothetical protein